MQMASAKIHHVSNTVFLPLYRNLYMRLLNSHKYNHGHSMPWLQIPRLSIASLSISFDDWVFQPCFFPVGSSMSNITGGAMQPSSHVSSGNRSRSHMKCSACSRKPLKTTQRLLVCATRQRLVAFVSLMFGMHDVSILMR